MRETNKMKDHVIICGFGRVGMQVAKDISSRGDEFVVLEQNQEVIDGFRDHEKIRFLKGDSTNDDILLKAGIKNARAIITCLPKDANNIYVVLAARENNKDILIVSRASQNSAVSKLKMEGIPCTSCARCSRTSKALWVPSTKSQERCPVWTWPNSR